MTGLVLYDGLLEFGSSHLETWDSTNGQYGWLGEISRRPSGKARWMGFLQLFVKIAKLAEPDRSAYEASPGVRLCATTSRTSFMPRCG